MHPLITMTPPLSLSTSSSDIEMPSYTTRYVELMSFNCKNLIPYLNSFRVSIGGINITHSEEFTKKTYDNTIVPLLYVSYSIHRSILEVLFFLKCTSQYNKKLFSITVTLHHCVEMVSCTNYYQS